MIDSAPSVAAEPREPLPSTPVAPSAEVSDSTLVEADLLVEDVSIDGMCGVY